MKNKTAILEGTKGQFYQRQSGVIKRAIEEDADSSYANSPAKTRAIQSADTWEHSGTQHVNNIVSFLYANYRQYGCGGLKIAKLVNITPAKREEMFYEALRELGTPGI